MASTVATPHLDHNQNNQQHQTHQHQHQNQHQHQQTQETGQSAAVSSSSSTDIAPQRPPIAHRASSTSITNPPASIAAATTAPDVNMSQSQPSSQQSFSLSQPSSQQHYRQFSDSNMRMGNGNNAAHYQPPNSSHEAPQIYSVSLPTI